MGGINFESLSRNRMPANVTLLRGAGSSRLSVYELEFRNRLAHGEGAIV